MFIVINNSSYSFKWTDKTAVKTIDKTQNVKNNLYNNIISKYTYIHV